ncbi:MAG: hypothetical protein LBC41_09785 [Clostridiales bacterium]|nr:hypothetical protein [Clostridiales bacterium]
MKFGKVVAIAMLIAVSGCKAASESAIPARTAAPSPQESRTQAPQKTEKPEANPFLGEWHDDEYDVITFYDDYTFQIVGYLDDSYGEVEAEGEYTIDDGVASIGDTGDTFTFDGDSLRYGEFVLTREIEAGFQVALDGSEWIYDGDIETYSNISIASGDVTFSQDGESWSSPYERDGIYIVLEDSYGDELRLILLDEETLVYNGKEHSRLSQRYFDDDSIGLAFTVPEGWIAAPTDSDGGFYRDFVVLTNTKDNESMFMVNLTDECQEILQSGGNGIDLLILFADAAFGDEYEIIADPYREESAAGLVNYGMGVEAYGGSMILFAHINPANYLTLGAAVLSDSENTEAFGEIVDNTVIYP